VEWQSSDLLAPYSFRPAARRGRPGDLRLLPPPIEPVEFIRPPDVPGER
jgi:hypothetical protein